MSGFSRTVCLRSATLAIDMRRIGNDFGSGTFLGAGPDIGYSRLLGA